MAALTAGTKAPDFELRTIDGKPFALRDELARRPVVLAFFKGSCPVCQYAFPFLERLHKAHGGKNVALVGVSQDDAKATLAFMKDFGVTFPVLLDDPRLYAASNAYGLTNVPTTFLISPEGEIEFSTVSWSKADVEQLNRRLAALSNVTAGQIFFPGETVSEFKPG